MAGAKRAFFNWRLAVCLLPPLSLGAYTAHRLLDLHLGGKASDTLYYFTREVPGLRGGIYAGGEKKTPLAVSTVAWSYHFDPFSITNPPPGITAESVAREISQRLELPYEEVLAVCTATNRGKYVPLRPRKEIAASDSVHKALTANPAIAGLIVEDDQVRTYLCGGRFGSITGYVNKEGDAFFGVEQAYDAQMRGIPGRIEGQRDAKRREIPQKRVFKSDPIPGADVYLTIDRDIQYAAEDAVAAAVASNSARSGFALVMEVRTGRILAMASCPEFDPVEFRSADADAVRNRCVSYNYEPGSMMKVIACAAALNEGAVTPDTKLDVGMGSWNFAGFTLHDHPTGVIDCRDAIAKSSNIYFAKVVVGDDKSAFPGIGPSKMYDYMRMFGFGEKPGTTMPGEQKGLLRPWKKWSRVQASRVPIGQGVSVTGLQLASAYATIANDGIRMKPYFVEKVVSGRGETLVENKPRRLGRVIKEKAARDLREMMKGTVSSEGTARRAAIRGYSVAGKTGTSQQVVNRRYSQKDYWASFCGMIPAGKPELVILVTIDRPKPIHTGGYVAAPVFKAIAETAVRTLEIPPDRPGELLEDEERRWRENLVKRARGSR